MDLWLTAGDFTETFEKKLSKYLGIRHALFVNSGSSANLLALSALKIFYNLNDGTKLLLLPLIFLQQ